jgi:hypothetical protein
MRKVFMPETIAKRKVLLIADAHLNLIWSLPRLFHQAGAHLVLLAPQTQLFRHSRFVDEWIDLQPGFQETLGGRIATQLAAHRDALVVFTSQPLLDIFFERRTVACAGGQERVSSLGVCPAFASADRPSLRNHGRSCRLGRASWRCDVEKRWRAWRHGRAQGDQRG